MRWHDLIEEFRDLTPEERLEELVEMADRLPPVSAERSAKAYSESCRVKECQTPVYLWVEVRDNRVYVEADVSPKSPTVRGLVALVVEGIGGATIEEVLTLPADPVGELGLTEILGMTRQQGLRGVIARIQRDIRTASAREQNSQ
jgi:cysteine desulfuration protein SufE